MLGYHDRYLPTALQDRCADDMLDGCYLALLVCKLGLQSFAVIRKLESVPDPCYQSDDLNIADVPVVIKTFCAPSSAESLIRHLQNAGHINS